MVDRGVAKTENEILISRSCELIKKSTQYRVTRDSSLQRTRKMRSADCSGSCQIISGAGIWPLTNCRMPSDLENSIAHLYENGRARRERKTSRVTFCRSLARSVRLGSDPRARKQLTSQRADPRISPLDSRRYDLPPSSPDIDYEPQK